LTSARHIRPTSAAGTASAAWRLCLLALGVLLALAPRARAQDTLVLRPALGEPAFRGIRFQHEHRLGRPKVGLVLSGGGARGLAQIGVLRTLERNHIPIDLIVGNSFGSVIGGLYASGYSIAAIESIAVHANWSELLSFSEETKRTDLFVGQKQAHPEGYLVIRFNGLEPVIPSSISGGQRLSNFFSYLSLQALYHPSPSFDDLKIPFRATSTDLVSGKRIVLENGSLAEAMRASVTVPLLYAPILKDSMALVDGGLTSNIPVDVARNLGCDVVIAVNSTSSMRNSSQLGLPWEIADQIMTIMMQHSNAEQLKQADVVITPETGERIVSDFTGVDDLIAAGERSSQACLEAVRAALERPLAPSRPQTAGGADDPIAHLRFDGDSLPEHLRSGIEALARQDSLTPARLQQELNLIAAEGRYFNVYASVASGNPSAAVVHAERVAPLHEMVVTGNSHLSAEEIREEIGPLDRDGIRYDDIQRALERVIQVYRDRGYSLARVESVRVDPVAGELRFSVNEGTIAEIRYEGNERTKDYVIRREFPLDVGNVFTIADATQGIVNIRSTGLFEYVLLDVRYEQNHPVIVLKVKERSAELLRFGVRADNEHNIVGTMSIRDANFRGAWEDLGLTGRYGYRDRMVLGEYSINRIFHSYLTLSLKGYLKSRDILSYGDDPTTPQGKWERVEIGKYREVKYGWSMAFGSHFERYGDVTAEIRSERHSIGFISGTGYTPEEYRYVGMKLQSIVDTEDKFSFPSSGTMLTLSYEFALGNVGSDVSFSKFTGVYESYVTIASRHTIRPRLTIGFADATLPLAERFSLGGMGSFYGLQEDDSRGRQLFLVNLEYRYRIPFSFLFDTYLKARYDLGTISLVPEELKFGSFRHGIGVELDLDTPIGPAAFGAGRSFYFRRDLPNTPVTTGPLLWYFAVGAPF
jgi:NTE family protein